MCNILRGGGKLFYLTLKKNESNPHYHSAGACTLVSIRQETSTHQRAAYTKQQRLWLTGWWRHSRLSYGCADLAKDGCRRKHCGISGRGLCGRRRCRGRGCVRRRGSRLRGCPGGCRRGRQQRRPRLRCSQLPSW